MSRWGKNIVVPLERLEKENTNRPTVARSVGTVGKWGKMGFTSTRTYAISSLAAAAAAAAAATSPDDKSPAYALDDALSPSVPEPPKPKKFFKSRNSAPPEVIAQIIQQLPRASTSPIRDYNNSASATPSHQSAAVQPIKLKIPKTNSAERKKKSPKVAKVKTSTSTTTTSAEASTQNDTSTSSTKATETPKLKKKKEEKKLKPEAAPSRVTSRARKVVNYCEDDEFERMPTPIKDIVIPKEKSEDLSGTNATADIMPAKAEPVLPPPALPPGMPATTSVVSVTPKTPEHPPIVLRISKGTSRLVSTDSEEQQPNNNAASSPLPHDITEPSSSSKSRHTSTEEVPAINTAAVAATPVYHPTTTPKIIVKPPKPPPSPEPVLLPQTAAAAAPATTDSDETPEFNFCTVKISPDKPPKERLKLIIKTDVIRTALAAAAAKAAAAAEKAAAAAEAAAAGIEGGEQRPEKEKKQKTKRHKHPKHAAIEQLTTPAQSAPGSEFKTPSPHLALGGTTIEPPPQQQQQPLNIARTIISPPALSERDFDSQSSVLGSISSKGNSTPQLLAQTVQEESCVIHSRGSSVITSDLETSQHSSLVAPPSDIESRLESMMMDGEVSQRVTNLVEEEPLEEDILAVLRGDESQMLVGESTTTTTTAPAATVENIKINGATLSREETGQHEAAEEEQHATAAKTRRITRGRGRAKAVYDAPDEEEKDEVITNAVKTQPTTRGARARKPLNAQQSQATTKPQIAAAAEITPAATKRATRRGAKKSEEAAAAAAQNNTDASPVADVELTPTKANSLTTTAMVTTRHSPRVAEKTSPSKSEEENTPVKTTPETDGGAAAASETVAATTTPITTRRGRPPRNAASNNNNNLNSSNNNNNNNINKIAANLSAKAGAAEVAKGVAKTAATTTSSTNATTTATTTTSPTIAAATTTTAQPRSYGRKRKNQQVTQVLQPSAEEIEEQLHATPAKVASIDLPAMLAGADDDQRTTHAKSAANMSPAHTTSPPPNAAFASSGYQSQTPTFDMHDNNSNNSNSLTRPPSSTTPTSPTAQLLPRRDYKVKDKFKRTLMLDNQVNCNAVVASPTAATLPNDPSTAHNNNNDEEQQRGSVKLVISKKKGSIFKSRALVQNDQSEQAAAKRHLYKHRWDAEANGGNTSDVPPGIPPPAKVNDVQVPQPTAGRTTAEDIFDDFNEDLSTGAPSRENSPAFGKLTRVSKQTNSQQAFPANPFDMDVDAAETDTFTSVRVDRKAKGYYTVVRNVKTAHQIQEIGEYQEMDDDVEYILDALQPHNPTPTRCLSALQLATKCMTPAFRMHVRAHGVVTKFFKALSDANTDLSLGLCTSAIMFILSQEGLNMDLDSDSLELMMNLLKADGVAAPSDRATYERNKQKVRELCEEIKAQGKATHLNVDSITVGTLAMETLLSLTSKRAGEWFKEELRELGGLEHIIKTISDCCRPVIECSQTRTTTSSSSGVTWTQTLLENMQTVERCMRVLENVTQMNEENQNYMLSHAQGSAVNTLCLLYAVCDRELQLHPTTETTSRDDPGVIMRELLIPVMKVLINLTHTFNPAHARGAELLGKRTDIIETSFHLLLQAPNYIPDRCVFDLSLLVLLLLINFTMYTIPNRMFIMKAYAPAEYISNAHTHEHHKISAIQAVIEYFYKCEELARLVEKNTDAILDNTDKNKKKQEEVDETVNNLLQKAGHHMEHTLKGSYAGILIGHLISDNEEYEAIVRTHLRGNGFKEIISVLEKYHTFMNLTASSEASVVAHIKSTKKLIDYFKKRDLVYQMNDETNDCALPLNLEKHQQSDNTTSSNTMNATISTTTRTSPTTSTSNATTRSATQRVVKTYSQR